MIAPVNLNCYTCHAEIAAEFAENIGAVLTACVEEDETGLLAEELPVHCQPTPNQQLADGSVALCLPCIFKMFVAARKRSEE